MTTSATGDSAQERPSQGSPHGSPDRRSPRPGLLLCCLLVAVLGVYIPVLGGPFIWDDHHLVEESPLVQQMHPVADYFGQGFWQGDDVEPGRTYYRPLSILSLALDKKIYGDNSSGFHLTNLIFHLLSTCLLFRLLRTRGVSGYGALLGCALWALHPRLTEAVAWISGRTDVLAGFFVLCALVLQGSRKRGTSLGVALCLLLGLLCKEVALAGVAAVLVMELIARTSYRTWLQRTLPTLLELVVYLVLRSHAIGMGSEQETQLPWAARFAACVAAIGHYCCMLCAPWLPDIQIGHLKRPDLPCIVLGGLALAGGTAWLSWFARRSPRLSPELGGALALTAVALGLVLHLIPFSINVLAADRFMYLPVAGLVLAITPKLASSSRATVLAALTALLAASFAAVTFVRASSWSDEVRFWTTALRESDADSSLACVELGSLYARAGLFPRALSVFGHGADPDLDAYAITVNNAATVAARAGRYQEASALLTPIALRFPGVPLFSLNLALFQSYLNHFDVARVHLARALALFPEYPQGNALARRLPDMESQRHTLDALPASAPPVERARLLGKLGLAAESVSAWQTAVADPSLAQKDVEEGLWFALREGSADNVDAMYSAYAKRFPTQRDARLDLVYDTRTDMVHRLNAAWPSLGLDAGP